MTRRQKAEILLKQENGKSGADSESELGILDWIKKRPHLSKKGRIQHEKDYSFTVQTLKEHSREFKRINFKHLVKLRGKGTVKSSRAKAHPRFGVYPRVMKKLDFLRFKYHRVKTLWNGNMRRFRRFLKRPAALPDYDTFMQRGGASAHPDDLRRLAINRLDFLIQGILISCTDKKMFFSMLDNFVIYRTIVKYKERHESLYCKYSLISSYLRRSTGTIMSQVMRMRKGLKIEDIKFLCNHVVAGFLWGGSNEVRLIKHGGDVELYNDRRVTVIRFSFLIDLFLLTQFRKYDFDFFVDDPELVCKVEKALAAGQSLDFLRREKKRYLGWEPKKGEEEFIVMYERVLNGEAPFLQTLLRLEKHILKQRFDQSFRLYADEDRLQRNTDAYNAKEKAESEDSSQNASLRSVSQDSPPKPQSPLLTKRSHQDANPAPETNPNNPNPNEPKPSRTKNLSLKRRVPRLGVCFFEFGVEYLKSHSDSASLEVEDLSSAEKRLLLSLVAHLKSFPEKSELAGLLGLMLGQSFGSVKEYLRCLNVLSNLLKGSQLNVRNAGLKMRLLHVILKIDAMVRVLERKVFGVAAGPGRDVAKSSWLVDFINR